MAKDKVVKKDVNKGPVISVRALKKRYKMGKNNFVDALKGVSVEIKAGEMVAIMGPSGSGKSTLMHLIGCLDRTDSGEITLAGENVSNMDSRDLTRVRSREIGFIFQHYNLITTLSAIENVALAADYAGKPHGEALKLARAALEKVGLGDRTGHLPTELSGGQQQRVAIARALVNQPQVILGDEPTGNLDTASSDEVIKMIQEVNRTTGTTFVIVTHNPEIAKLCHRTINMRDGLVV